MHKNTTLKDLTQFYKNEKQLLTQCGLSNSPKKDENLLPKQSTIDFILNYSKVLSVRKSVKYGIIEMVLN